MSLFMYPVYGFKNGNLSIEFATQRGGIHFHTPGALKNRIIPLIADALMLFARVVDREMELVNAFCADTYSKDLHQAKHPTPPHLICNQAGKKARQDFGKDMSEGREVWADYLCVTTEANLV